MSKQTDTIEDTYLGTTTVRGDLEISGIFSSDTIRMNTTGNGVSIEGINFATNYYTMPQITQPANPTSGLRFYVESGSLKSVTSAGAVTIYGTGSFTAGTGISIVGSTISIANTGTATGSFGSGTLIPVLTVNAQGQITSISTTALTLTAGTGISIVGTTVAIANTGAPTGTFGSATQIPQFTVNAQGQLTAASNAVTLSGGTGITYSTGVISITNTTVTAGTYGSTTQIPQFTVNNQGQLTAASNVVTLSGGTGITYSTGTISINNTGVTAGTYGSSTQIPQFTVNAQGQITTASNAVTLSGGTGITFSSGTISITNTGTATGSFGSSSQIPVITVNAQGQITSITTAANTSSFTAGTGISIVGSVISIANTTVTAGTYGSSTQIPQFTVNAQGQLTAASNAVTISGGTNITFTSGTIATVSNPTFTNITLTGSTAATDILTGVLTAVGGISTQNRIVSPELWLQNITAPGNPTAGYDRLYIDSADTLLKSRDSSGNITIYNPLTTKGDLFTTASSSTIGTRLAIGTSGQILSVNPVTTTGLQWQNFNLPFNGAVAEYYGTATTTVTTNTDLQIDQFRVTPDSCVVLNITTNTDVIIKATGKYLIVAKVCLVKTVGTTINNCQVVMVEDPTNSGTFTAVAGVNGYTLNSSTANSTSDTCYLIYARTYSAGARIKIQATRSTGTDTITQRSFGVNLSVTQFAVDSEFDTTLYYNAYTTATQALTGTFTGIATPTSRISDAGFTYSAPTVTVANAGTYIGLATFNVQKTAGTDNSLATFRFTRNGTQIGTTSIVPILTSTNGFCSGAGYVIFTASANDQIQIQGQLTTGTNLSSVSGTGLTLIYLQSSTNSQASTKYIYMTSTTNTSLAATVTELPFQTEVIKSATGFTHSTVTNTNIVTVQEDGYYYIFSSLSMSNAAAAICNTQALILYSNGIAFNFYEGTYSEAFQNVSGTSGTRTLMTHSFVYLPANFQIKIQALRNSATGTITTTGTNCSFGMIKASVNQSPFDPIRPYGTQLLVGESNYSSTTSSTTFVAKLLLPTGTIASGWYRLDYTLKNNTANTETMRVQIVVYNGATTSTLITTNLPRPSQSTDTPFYSGFVILPFIQGSYTFELDYASTGGAAVIIREVNLTFKRIL